MKSEQISHYIDKFTTSYFKDDLIEWFRREQRILPWRANKDPYKVWVSEIMLQQTQVNTVIPYFERFITKFPTPDALASAEEQDVLKAWEGLGYYSRARNLQYAVQEVVTEYGGKVPDTPKELSKLKGVGPYTSGAILSIAYDVPEPAVDGNVMRVLSRVLKIEEDIAKPKTRKVFEACVRELISKEDPSSFNQGLMELGALICTPKKPSCSRCPVQQHCKAFSEGVEELLPIKTKAKKQKKIPYIALIIMDGKGRYLIEKRPEKGLLANLWQFPMAPLIELESVPKWFYGEYGIRIKLNNNVDKIKHTFSHVIWELEVITASKLDGSLDFENASFKSLEEIALLPFPVSHQKMMKHLYK